VRWALMSTRSVLVLLRRSTSMLMVSLELEAVLAWALQPGNRPPLEGQPPLGMTLEPEGWLRRLRLVGA